MRPNTHSTLALAMVITLFAPLATGQVALDPVTSGRISVSLPRGWQTTTDTSRGVFFAQRNANRKDAPAMMVVVQSTGVTVNTDQLLDSLLAQAATDVKVIERTRLGRGERQVIAEGTAGGVRAKLAGIAMVRHGGVVLGLLASAPGEFDRLGGAGLVGNVLASITIDGQSAAEPADTAVANKMPVMQSNQTVNLEKGRLPQLTRPITIDDLAGDWKDAGSGITNWYSAQTGTFLGASTILSSATYHISANGRFHKEATHVALGNTMASVTSQDAGVITVAGPAVIKMSLNNKNGPTWYGWYVVRGWYANSGQTVMKLNGPWQPRADGSLDPEAFNLDAFGKNTYYWIRGK
ncbi:MAG TPA: hypothetical protein VHV32_08705 [Candidatus Angelobacter sp.]|nr:hypothetical protein [Candidatus Angelobacter sp.]